MMYAMNYEYLIRTVFNVERGLKHGAEAGIYRKMIVAAEPPVNEYELLSSIGEVSMHLNRALKKAKEDHSAKSEFVCKIEKCESYLKERTVVKIEQCIDEAWNALNSLGLLTQMSA